MIATVCALLKVAGIGEPRPCPPPPQHENVCGRCSLTMPRCIHTPQSRAHQIIARRSDAHFGLDLDLEDRPQPAGAHGGSEGQVHGSQRVGAAPRYVLEDHEYLRPESGGDRSDADLPPAPPAGAANAKLSRLARHGVSLDELAASIAAQLPQQAAHTHELKRQHAVLKTRLYWLDRRPATHLGSAAGAAHLTNIPMRGPVAALAAALVSEIFEHAWARIHLRPSREQVVKEVNEWKIARHADLLRVARFVAEATLAEAVDAAIGEVYEEERALDRGAAAFASDLLVGAVAAARDAHGDAGAGGTGAASGASGRREVDAAEARHDPRSPYPGALRALLGALKKQRPAGTPSGHTQQLLPQVGWGLGFQQAFGGFNPSSSADASGGSCIAAQCHDSSSAALLSLQRVC